MTTAATTVVSRKARTFLRDRRPPANRLLCCDNAVLPSAKPAAQAAGRAKTAAGQGSDSRKELTTLGSDPGLPGHNDPNEKPTPLPHHVARSDATDQAFPLKKLCRLGRNWCRAGHRLALSIVTITRRNSGAAVITGSGQDSARHAGTTRHSQRELACQEKHCR
jgi:hypothetical protein